MADLTDFIASLDEPSRSAVTPGSRGCESTTGGIRFSDDRPLPDDVFTALVLGWRDKIDAAVSGEIRCPHPDMTRS